MGSAWYPQTKTHTHSVVRPASFADPLTLAFAPELENLQRTLSDSGPYSANLKLSKRLQGGPGFWPGCLTISCRTLLTTRSVLTTLATLTTRSARRAVAPEMPLSSSIAPTSENATGVSRNPPMSPPKQVYLSFAFYLWFLMQLSIWCSMQGHHLFGNPTPLFRK